MRPILLPILTVLTLWPSVAQATPASDARRMIQAAYKSIDAATERRDAAGATAYYAPGFVSIDAKGRRSPAARDRQAAAGLFAMTRGPIAAKTTVLKFSLSGPNTATATIYGHITTKLANPQTQEVARATFAITSRDLWVRAGRGWRQKQSQAISTAMTFNGKPVPQD